LSGLVPIPFGRVLSSWPVQNAFGIGVAVAGLAGVFSSMMIYRDTRRTFWRMKFVSMKFAGTTVLLGPATILFTMTLQSLFLPGIVTLPAFRQVIVLLCEFLAAAMTTKLLWELTVFMHLKDREWTDMKRTALLMSGVLKRATVHVSFAERLEASCSRCWCCSTFFPRSSRLESCLFRCSVNCSSAICFSRR
jgi:DMSO reductase anchor subunit